MTHRVVGIHSLHRIYTPRQKTITVVLILSSAGGWDRGAYGGHTSIHKTDLICATISQLHSGFYSRAAASLMMVWVGIVVLVVQETIVS